MAEAAAEAEVVAAVATIRGRTTDKVAMGAPAGVGTIKIGKIGRRLAEKRPRALVRRSWARTGCRCRCQRGACR